MHPRKAVTINFSAHKLILERESLDHSTALFMYCFPFYFNFVLIILIPGLKFYRPSVYIQMGTSCAPLVVLFCHERYLMLSLSENNQDMLLKSYFSTLRYVDDLLNIGPFHVYLCYCFLACPLQPCDHLLGKG